MSGTPEHDHYLPITTHSELARKPTHFPEGYMNVPTKRIKPLLGKTEPTTESGRDVMRRNIPRLLRGSCLQERIQRIWNARSLRKLSLLLESPLDDTTVAILTYNYKVRPVIQLRYRVWHPQVESMQYWLQLFGQMLFFCAGVDEKEFSDRVREIDASLLDFKKLDQQDRWKCILTLMRFDNTFAYWWDELKKNEREGGRISPKSLYRQRILGKVPGIEPIKLAQPS
ncbi:hypothetical protein B0T10DRAFT_559421 [Thelonectria olida]|uniref:Uncharacterized protein n=1 Tax=Thelonectria olida TaxID=1576542 RepID=A0A9P9AT13_9HYPO|nr:hypothetical protein B0T10DRAFT_559421 [Thelonectria olida]